MQIKLKPLALAVAALSLPFTAAANQSLNHAGYTQTTGGVVNEGTVNSSSFNPAGNNLLLKQEEKFRFGYFSNLGLSLEIGEAEDLDDKIDYVQDALDDPTNSAHFDKVGEIMHDLEKAGQLRINAHVQAPLTPFLFRSTLAQGTFSLNASVGAQISAGVIGAPVNVSVTTGGKDIDIDVSQALGAYAEIEQEFSGSNISYDDLMDILKRHNLTSAVEQLKDASASGSNIDFSSPEIKTNAGLDIRAARIAHFSVGYGTDLSNWFELDRSHGVLEGGLRANLYNVEMGRNFLSLQVEADSDDDISDSLTDDFFDNTETSTNVGLDLGFLWHSDNYQAGITFYNLNEPSFDYPDLGKFVDNDTKTVLQELQDEGRTKIKDSVTLTRHAVIEGAYFSQNRNWMLQGAYTVGTATNFVGDEYRNLHLAAGYYSKSAWLPGIRFGYSKNFTGSELSKLHLGSTFFGIFNLDVAVATNTSSFDGNSVPRYVAFNIGFEEKF